MAPQHTAATAPPQAPSALSYLDAKEVHEVWESNLDQEFEALVAAAVVDNGAAILALDVEFSGFLLQEPRTGARAVRYQAVRENVDQLHPIQVGAAVAGADGSLRGVWSFNLRFDAEVDLHTKSSLAFLRAAGLDFPRHAAEGIDATRLGECIANSGLVGQHGRAPWWITFSGSHDLGHLLKLLTSGRPLPESFGAFEAELSSYCPRRHELRNELPYGSLQSLARTHGLQRHGCAHTAGSDALLTLELFLRVVGGKLRDQRDRWNPWAPVDAGWAADAWAPAWGVAWHGTWPLPFVNTAPHLLWLPASLAGPVPALAGGAPMPSASFWGAAGHGMVNAKSCVADASVPAPETTRLLPKAPDKVMEI